MKILAIETSCDETAIAILNCFGDEKSAQFRVLGNAIASQIEIHRKYGGVSPALAKREHAKNLVPILEATLEESELLRENTQIISEEMRAKIATILARESGLSEAFFEFISKCEPPEIDVIAVTHGPGLEPALWVGINFARALSIAWNKPIVAINHMEGHILSALARQEVRSIKHEAPNKAHTEELKIHDVRMPVLALLISGGHTELVLMKKWFEYKLIGQTRDDAVGEAFDKVARMLSLPYPGGPEISRLAEHARISDALSSASDAGRAMSHTLPRPMINSNTCDFSFAGLKTAVLYLLKRYNVPVSERSHENRNTSDEIFKMQIAHEFENAVTDVLWIKTKRALEETSANTLVIGGGVSANTHVRRVFKTKMDSEFPKHDFLIPDSRLTTDNAIMIAIAGFYRASRKEFVTDISANGNLRLV